MKLYMVTSVNVSGISNTRESEQNTTAQNTIVHRYFLLQFLEIMFVVGFDINHIVRDLIPGVIDLLHNIELVFGKDFGDRIENTRLVFVDNRDSGVPGLSFGKRCIGEVHRVTNRPVFQVQSQSLGRHGGRRIFGFSRRRTQVRKNDTVGVIPDQIIGEIGNVLCPRALVEKFLHGVRIYQFAPSKVENDGIGFAMPNNVLSNNAVRSFCVRNVQTNVVCVCYHRRDAIRQFQTPRQFHCRIHRQTRIVSHQFHPQFLGIPCRRRSNVSKADHRQSLSTDLSSTKHRFVLFNAFSGQSLYSEVLHVVDSINDSSASQKHAAQDQFLDGIGIGSGSVEDGNAQFCHASDRNIVCTSTASGNGSHGRKDLFFF
mmetsp:Transcript_1469/g.3064  ORF Transcript_1469/g.3064 Transcript_1469/m.3064 type:complete len:371 (-) Transcript_1469:298-1410(-)